MTTTPRQDDQLKRAIGLSVFLHVAVFSVFAVRMVFYDGEPLVLEDAIRVDIVALPDKAPATLPPEPVPEPVPVSSANNSQKPEPAKPVAAPKPEAPQVNLNKVKKDQEAALKRLEALQNLEKMMKSQQQTGEAKPTQASAGGPPAPVKGNVVSAGNALTGIARLDHQSYLGVIRAAVVRNYRIPAFMRTANIRARVRIYLDAQGMVIKKELVSSSNNEVFDSNLMDAIDRSNPFPAPPGTLTNRVNIDGIELEFSPGQQ